MSGPYQGRDLSNCGVGRLRVAINCGVLSVKEHLVMTSRGVDIQTPQTAVLKHPIFNSVKTYPPL